MNKHFTIKDLAEKLSIHHTTVSRALRNHPDVNENTRKMVLAAAKQFNYVPNSFAKSLRSAQSRTIVVMVPNIKNFFFSEVMSVITNHAYEAGYSVMIYQSNDGHEMELQNLETILENRVAGVIASIADMGENRSKFQQLQDREIPLVFFDRFYDDPAFTKVIVQNFQGGFDATSYLIGAGHKVISFYKGNNGNPVFDERYRGFTEAMDSFKLSVSDHLIFEGGIELEDGISLVQKLKEMDTMPTALVCAVDMVALGVIIGARDLNMEIPKDLAVIGFDNEPTGSIIKPALTTLAQPVEKIGITAFELLLDKINKKENRDKMEVLLPMDLITRSST